MPGKEELSSQRQTNAAEGNIFLKSFIHAHPPEDRLDTNATPANPSASVPNLDNQYPGGQFRKGKYVAPISPPGRVSPK